MFGYQGGESGETVARKRGYMAEARQRWPFLTRFDVTTIHNEQQLATMVRDRSGRSKADADEEVHTWMEGKTF
ncbi:hypothetical protein D3218_16015 [Aureimonas flava]|uniref:Uncharacterized protein n=1 Tax=Aureimonas flava TaxID=2320271 RepID=A0A3A1WFJ5_9HYPH|nr:hypothetical protein [Aureimonas flava]RIX98696.1 hypothetical protein D3218_16015 [Aureimonas flava]